MEKKKFDPGTEILGCFQMVKAALMPSSTSDDVTKTGRINSGRLRALNLIGSGGQANVYRGFYGNCEVAIKKFKTADEIDEPKLTSLLRMKRHKNIVALYGLVRNTHFDSFCHGPALIMELARCSLYSVIHGTGQIDSLMVLDYAAQIADGMRHLHRNEIIHRDLKSANILLGYDGQLKISDLDSHTLGDKNKSSISFQGTVQWMAPELIRHEQCSQSVDVWSYGIILWELLTRQVPYQDWNQQQVMWEVGNGRIKTPVPATTPPQIGAIIKRCIEMEPEKRSTFDEITKMIPFAESDMKNIPLHQLEQFRTEWQSEVAEVLEEFLRSKATCISDRMEKELVEISQLKSKIQRVYDNIIGSDQNDPDQMYTMMHQLPFSFRSSVLRASLTASQSLPGYSNELVFDSSFNRSLSGSRRVQSKQKRKKSQAPPLTGLVNSGYHSDEYSADVSDVDGGVRPATISRNMTWRPSQQHSKSDIENTTADDCSTSSNHPQSSGEDTAENMYEEDLLSSDDSCEAPITLPKTMFDSEPTDEGFVSRNTTICLDQEQRASTLERINRPVHKTDKIQTL